MADEAPTLVQQFIDAWNSHDPERILALCTDDIVYEDVTFAAVSRGRVATQQFVAGAFAAFPDIRFELLTAVVAGDRGAAEWTMAGTHAGDFPGLPATGKSFTVRGASIFDIAGGKIRHNRDYWDFATVLRQLGLMPEAAGV